MSLSLHQVAQDGNKELVRAMLNQKIDPDSLNPERETALHVACAAGHPGLVELLLEQGATVDLPDKQKCTPLHIAAHHGKVECARILLQHKAIPNAVDMELWTPLHYAVFNSHVELAVLLIESGAQVSAQNDSGDTPLHIAAKRGNVDCAIALVNANAPLDVPNDTGKTPLACLPVKAELPRDSLSHPDEQRALFKRNMLDLLKDPELADVRFEIGIPPKPMYAHQVILSARCASFKKLLAAGSPTGEDGKFEIKVKDAAPVAFSRFLEWLYTGEITHWNKSEAPGEADTTLVLEILRLAEAYDVKALRIFCGGMLLKSLDKSNIASVLKEIAVKAETRDKVNESTSDETPPIEILIWAHAVKNDFLGPVIAAKEGEVVFPRKKMAELLARLPVEKAPAGLRQKSSKEKKVSTPVTKKKKTPEPVRAAPRPAPTPAADGKLSEKDMRQCTRLLRGIKSNPKAFPFLKPVDPIFLGIPDYPLIIKFPMDISTVETKLKQGTYTTPEQFAGDVRLMFNNAMVYNMEGAPIHTDAKNFLTTFEKNFKKNTWDGPADDTTVLPDYPKVHPTTQLPLGHPAGNQDRKRKADDSARRKPIPSKKAKPLDRELTMEEKQQLCSKINDLTADQLDTVVDIISKSKVKPDADPDSDNVEVDINELDNDTLLKLHNFVESCM